MRKLLSSVLLSVCCVSVNAADRPALLLHEGDVSDEPFLAVLTDSAFNAMQNALFISADNELLVGNLGVDMYAVANTTGGMEIVYPAKERTSPLEIKETDLEHGSLVIPTEKDGAIKFQGREYPLVVRVKHSVPTHYVALSQLPKEFGLCANENKPILYMINDRIIMDDANAYKVDKNFVLKVELESSKNLYSLQNYPEVQIVRAYTKTHQNMSTDSFMRIR